MVDVDFDEEAVEVDKANGLDETDDSNVANSTNFANKANEASLIEEADDVVNDVIAIDLFLYSLTKYSATSVKVKGSFGIMISNYQHGIDNRSSCFWAVSEKRLRSLCSFQIYHSFITTGKYHVCVCDDENNNQPVSFKK